MKITNRTKYFSLRMIDNLVIIISFLLFLFLAAYNEIAGSMAFVGFLAAVMNSYIHYDSKYYKESYD